LEHGCSKNTPARRQPHGRSGPADRRHLQGFGFRQRRQQPRKTLGQQRFADTGRAGHHQVMGTGRGDLNCEPGPPHRRGPQWVPAPATECRSGQPLVQLPQCSDAPHLDALDQAGLGEVVDGYYNGRPSRLAASTAGSTPFTGRTRPSSANSPSSTVFSSRSHAFLPLADKTAEASASAKGRLIQF